MKVPELLDPMIEFMKSAKQVHDNAQHIERLESQADIALRNMKEGGAVDKRAFDSITGRAIELRLIDKDDVLDMKADTIEDVEVAFEFIKLNTRAITAIAFSDPNEYAKRVNPLTTPIRTMDEPKRRHFSDLSN